MSAGNVVALLSPLVFTSVLAYALDPLTYDNKSMAAIRLGKGRGHWEKAPSRGLLHYENYVRIHDMGDDHFGAHAIVQDRINFKQEGFYRLGLRGIFWLFCSSFAVGLFPLWEGTAWPVHTRVSYKDLSGNGRATI